MPEELGAPHCPHRTHLQFLFLLFNKILEEVQAFLSRKVLAIISSLKFFAYYVKNSCWSQKLQQDLNELIPAHVIIGGMSSSSFSFISCQIPSQYSLFQSILSTNSSSALISSLVWLAYAVDNEDFLLQMLGID